MLAKRVVLAISAFAVLSFPAAAEAPRVVATIKPLQALAAGVMDGIGTPTLLLRAATSAHTYTLRPSDLQTLQRAQVVLWIGPDYESSMAKAIGALPKTTVVMRAARAKGLSLLNVREGGVWDDGHSHGHGHSHSHAERDMHVWLDPANAKVLAGAIAEALSRADKANAARYAANAEALAARLDALDAELAAKTAPIRQKPFIVFHDAYQYFERRYGLTAAGSITVTPDRVPGPRRLAELRRTIAERGALCVFSEPQFTSTLVATVLEGTPARGGVLDPLGTNVPDGVEGYFALMHGLADGLKSCLLPGA